MPAAIRTKLSTIGCSDQAVVPGCNPMIALDRAYNRAASAQPPRCLRLCRQRRQGPRPGRAHSLLGGRGGGRSRLSPEVPASGRNLHRAANFASFIVESQHFVTSLSDALRTLLQEA